MTKRLEYPRDVNGIVRQCAWCRRVADGAGRYRFREIVMLESASHGCCYACARLYLRPRGGAATRVA